MKIPEHYLPVMPYLILNDATAFKQFAQQVFNAEDHSMTTSEDGKVRHGELKIGDALIMYADALEQWPSKTAGMFLYVEKVQEVYDKAISAGAKSLMEPMKKDYGFTAGFDDPFGNQWWIAEGEE